MRSLILAALLFAAAPLSAATPITTAPPLDWTMPETVAYVKLDWNVETAAKPPAMPAAPKLDWTMPMASPVQLDWQAAETPAATPPGMIAVPLIPAGVPLIQGRCTGPECQQQYQPAESGWYWGKRFGR